VLGRFLIVDPDLRTAQIVADACRAFRATDVLAEFGAALDVLDSARRLVAMITEVEFPGEEDGLDLVRCARTLRPLLPVLVLTSRTDPTLINGAHALRAEYHCKPTHRSSLRGFLRRAVALERIEDERISWAVDENSRRHRLTPREVDLLVAAVAGIPRKVLSDELGVSENTLKTQVRGLLRKTEATTLDELARTTLQLALSDAPAARTSSLPPESQHHGPPSIRPSGTRPRVSVSLEELEKLLAARRG
jgi:two-component system vancomycin resistance associated response regulator VraR